MRSRKSPLFPIAAKGFSFPVYFPVFLFRLHSPSHPPHWHSPFAPHSCRPFAVSFPTDLVGAGPVCTKRCICDERLGLLWILNRSRHGRRWPPHRLPFVVPPRKIDLNFPASTAGKSGKPRVRSPFVSAYDVKKNTLKRWSTRVSAFPPGANLGCAFSQI